MKFVTFSHRAGGDHHAGVLEGDKVACLTEAGIAKSVLEVVQGGASALDKVRAGLAKAPRYALSDIKLEAPIRPGKVLCSGINYKGHALENPNAKMPTEPFFFAKLPSSVVGPDTPVEKTDRTKPDGLRGRVLRRHRQAPVQGQGSRRDAGDLRLHAAERHLGARRAVQGQPDHHRQEPRRLRADRPMHRHSGRD